MHVVFSGGGSCVPFSGCSHCSKYSKGFTGSRGKASLSGKSSTLPLRSCTKRHRNFLTYSAMTLSNATDYISRSVLSNHKTIFSLCLREGRTQTLCYSWNSAHTHRIKGTLLPGLEQPETWGGWLHRTLLSYIKNPRHCDSTESNIFHLKPQM